MTKEEAVHKFDEYLQRMPIVLRSCWNCNPAHEHLKTAEMAMLCFVCGHYFYRGVDVTKEETPCSKTTD